MTTESTHQVKMRLADRKSIAINNPTLIPRVTENTGALHSGHSERLCQLKMSSSNLKPTDPSYQAKQNQSKGPVASDSPWRPPNPDLDVRAGAAVSAAAVPEAAKAHRGRSSVALVFQIPLNLSGFKGLLGSTQLSAAPEFLQIF